MKAGDYVRTKRGQFHKITDLKGYYENGNLIKEKQLVYIDNKNSGWNYEQFEEVIKKSSPNIIDLIEVGDYVNGTKVTMIAGTRYDKNDLHCYCDYCENKETRKWLMIPAKEIKSIVTKEQFERCEYKI